MSDWASAKKTRVASGDGTYLEFCLFPRDMRGLLTARGRVEKRYVEAHCWLKTGPVGFPMMVFDPVVLARLGWALLTASHRLARLQGPPVVDVAMFPQLTIYDALEVR